MQARDAPDVAPLPLAIYVMTQQYWEIIGYQGTEKIFERKVKLGCYTENQMMHLLRALAAKAGLEADEIVGAYAKRKTKGANDLLEVRRDSKNATLMCGVNPYFVARVVKEKS
ncbi:MAG TPA: hypothetical protein DHU56_04260 [Marinobacter sp.]|nr:hypothetical protein [Marinobacter sp.]